MKIELTAIYHNPRGEPCLKMNLLSENRLSVPFRLWWVVRYWKRMEITVMVKKEMRQKDDH